MARFLFDENLPPAVAKGLREFGIDAVAVGDEGAPVRGSSDKANVLWCVQQNALLVTGDHGRKRKDILELLKTTAVSILFTPRGIGADLVKFARFFMLRYPRLEKELDCATRRGQVRYRMNREGRLEKLV